MTKIDVKKLKRNSTILLETEETIFEITVTAPSKGGVVIHGGTKFVYKTEGSLVRGTIKRGESISIVYKDKDSVELKFKSSKVVSAKIYGPNKKWNYDAIEKKQKNIKAKKNEDTN